MDLWNCLIWHRHRHGYGLPREIHAIPHEKLSTTRSHDSFPARPLSWTRQNICILGSHQWSNPSKAWIAYPTMLQKHSRRFLSTPHGRGWRWMCIEWVIASVSNQVMWYHDIRRSNCAFVHVALGMMARQWGTSKHQKHQLVGDKRFCRYNPSLVLQRYSHCLWN